MLFNGAQAAGFASFALTDDRATDASAGTVSLAGPVDSARADARLAELDSPNPWWRLTHPLDLLSLAR